MRWLNSYFGDRRHGVIAIVDYTFAAGIELDDFLELILHLRVSATDGIAKCKGRARRGGIADLRGTGREWRSSVEIVGRRRTCASGECF